MKITWNNVRDMLRDMTKMELAFLEDVLNAEKIMRDEQDELVASIIEEDD
tara:strand:+ start:1337 stop:1486 length:150 start_codon:yes stop_codon:yes gene_type:complete